MTEAAYDPRPTPPLAFVGGPHARVPPHNLDAERSLLGGILLDGAAFNDVAVEVAPDEFYREANRKIFEAMTALAAKSEPIDRITLKAALVEEGSFEAVGGEAYVDLLDKFVPTAANLGYYAKIIREKALARKLIEAAGSIAQLGYEQHGDVNAFADECEARFYALRSRVVGKGFTVAKSLIAPAFKEIEARAEHETNLTGAPSGLDDLDQLLNGFQSSHLVIIAARPSMGKTSALMDILRSVCTAGGSAGMFSLEMPKAELIERVLAGQANVDLQHIRTGQLRGPEWERLAQAAGRISEWELHIDDTSKTIVEIRAHSRRLATKLAAAGRPLRLIGVDYLQLMRGTGREEKREEVVAEVSRELKALAKELQIPVIALSQLNRELERRPNKRPQMSDLRESGSLEQDADEIIFIYRGVVYGDKDMHEGHADLIVAKHRNGPIGDVRVAFMKECSSFRNLKAFEAQLRFDGPPPHTDEDAP